MYLSCASCVFFNPYKLKISYLYFAFKLFFHQFPFLQEKKRQLLGNVMLIENTILTFYLIVKKKSREKFWSVKIKSRQKSYSLGQNLVTFCRLTFRVWSLFCIFTGVLIILVKFVEILITKKTLYTCLLLLRG